MKNAEYTSKCLEQAAKIDRQRTSTAAGQPLGDYLSRRPSLMLTFLDVAERYSSEPEKRS